ncbi:MAG: oxidative damage protection protein [Gammaproteobacteria bacterium]|nr:oxidative damage protection protein [Gammaproteobacteria bacterium]
MTRIVKCSLLGSEAEGLDKPPYPGELGQRIYENVSKDAWQQWLERLVMIINEYQLNSSDLSNQLLIEQHLVGFLFQEGEFGQAPAGFTPAV